MVLNMRPLDWESSTLTTRPLNNTLKNEEEKHLETSFETIGMID